ANVHVGRIGGAFVALTDGDITPVAFDPTPLETRGALALDDTFAADVAERGARFTTAHFQYDFFADAVINYWADMGPASGYVIYGIGRGERRRTLIARYPVGETSSMHSFALTEHYVILLESPLRNPTLPWHPPLAEALRWRPELGSRFLVFR